jgi:hypothetical protein
MMKGSIITQHEVILVMKDHNRVHIDIKGRGRVPTTKMLMEPSHSIYTLIKRTTGYQDCTVWV